MASPSTRPTARRTAKSPTAASRTRTPARAGAGSSPSAVVARTTRSAPPAAPTAAPMTIGRLAQAAGVGVETVRYYQRRGLLPQPAPARGAYRHYPPAAAARLRFIRRAQQLGFTLEEIASLLQLSDGTDRRSIRRITAARLAQLQERMADMQKMADVLRHLLHECEHDGDAAHCPIIESIAGGEGEAALCCGPAR